MKLKVESNGVTYLSNYIFDRESLYFAQNQDTYPNFSLPPYNLFLPFQNMYSL